MNEDQTTTEPTAPVTTRRRRVQTQELAPLPTGPNPIEPVMEPIPQAQPEAAPQAAPVVVAEVARPGPDKFPNTDLSRFDAVQVINAQNRHYGLIFAVGDVRFGKVHGYFIAEGRNKQYVTIDLSDCHRIGESKIRTTTPCSPKWTSDNR